MESRWGRGRDVGYGNFHASPLGGVAASRMSSLLFSLPLQPPPSKLPHLFAVAWRRDKIECTHDRNQSMNFAGTQIVVCQPNGVTRIVVRFDGETAWLALPRPVRPPAFLRGPFPSQHAAHPGLRTRRDLARLAFNSGGGVPPQIHGEPPGEDAWQ